MKTLIVITGPTGVGKSDFAIKLAKRLSTEIISADSRQMFYDIPVSTAAPSKHDMTEVRHHLVGTLALDDYYSASMFESDALDCARDIWTRSDFAILCGGSMMYVDAVCYGIDEIPAVPQDLRNNLMENHRRHGDEWILNELQRLDPDYYSIVDKKNIKRVIHAVEICIASGVTYSSLRTGRRAKRDFHILKFCLTAPRETLFARINNRVGRMMESGLLEEAQRVYPLRHLNSLNTVGLKELFDYIDGKYTLTEAIDKICRNTRVYAKKQLTWFKRDASMKFIDVTKCY